MVLPVTDDLRERVRREALWWLDPHDTVINAVVKWLEPLLTAERARADAAAMHAAGLTAALRSVDDAREQALAEVARLQAEIAAAIGALAE